MYLGFPLSRRYQLSSIVYSWLFVVGGFVVAIKIAVVHAIAVLAKLADFKQSLAENCIVVLAKGFAVYFSWRVAFSC